MSTIRRIDANKYRWDDPRRYITLKDCSSEPEVLKTYCEGHPTTVCLGGYGNFGCCPEGNRKDDFIVYDPEKRARTRKDNGRTISWYETYCGRKLPQSLLKGKMYYENQIWNLARLGVPDLIDGNMVIEAKGGLPSSQKAHTALGQLLFYKENKPDLQLGFLFPRIWLDAENLQNHWNVFRKYGITLLPI